MEIFILHFLRERENFTQQLNLFEIQIKSLFILSSIHCIYLIIKITKIFNILVAYSRRSEILRFRKLNQILTPMERSEILKVFSTQFLFNFFHFHLIILHTEYSSECTSHTYYVLIAQFFSV